MNASITKFYNAFLLSFSLVGMCNPESINNHSDTAQNSNCTKLATIPCQKEFNDAAISNYSLKKEFTAAWGSLCAAYISKNKSTDPNSPEWEALKYGAFISNIFCELTPIGQDPELVKNLEICLDPTIKDPDKNFVDCQTNVADSYKALTVNYLTHMQEYLESVNLPELKNHIHHNYTTIHLSAALKRLSKTCSITVDDKKIPTTHFSGSIKDLGIIVNIVNNSNIQFHVTKSNDYKNPIAHIVHGLNGVNLYTAALEKESNNPTEKSTKKQALSTFCFFQLNDKTASKANNKPLFTVGIYTGAELINFLKTLPRKNPKIFDMNGCPTSEEYLANLTDLYMVLIKNNPSQKRNSSPNPNQRIQAINLSVLTGPYLLTMQINDIVNKKTNPTNKNKDSGSIIQPSFTSVQLISNKAPIAGKAVISANKPKGEQLDRSLLPLIILPKFLWDIPAVQLFWMLYSTSYISAMTDFSNFGLNKFGSAYDYFNDLGYFDTKQNYQFFIDKYNLLKAGKTLQDCPQFMSCSVYETSLENCSDIPGIYSIQNDENDFITNSKGTTFSNLAITFSPKEQLKLDSKFFNIHNFNATYDMFYHQLYTYILNFHTADLKESVFVKISQIKSKTYKTTWTNKKNDLLSKQNIYLNFEINKLKINFLRTSNDWQGTVIPTNLIPSSKSQSTHFKLTYTDPTDKHILTVSQTSPIDKMDFIHTIKFSKYPITDICYNLYTRFQVQPYTTCYIIKDGILPSFLASLIQNDWENGIYLIPSIKNNGFLTRNNPSALTVTFYNSNKQKLGKITTPGNYNNTAAKGIRNNVNVYKFISKQFDPVENAYISTGMLLKYFKSQKKT